VFILLRSGFFIPRARQPHTEKAMTLQAKYKYHRVAGVLFDLEKARAEFITSTQETNLSAFNAVEALEKMAVADDALAAAESAMKRALNAIDSLANVTSQPMEGR
jgi:hypothetical protein